MKTMPKNLVLVPNLSLTPDPSTLSPVLTTSTPTHNEEHPNHSFVTSVGHHTSSMKGGKDRQVDARDVLPIQVKMQEDLLDGKDAVEEKSILNTDSNVNLKNGDGPLLSSSPSVYERPISLFNRLLASFIVKKATGRGGPRNSRLVFTHTHTRHPTFAQKKRKNSDGAKVRMSKEGNCHFPHPVI